jgi:hypothetical protein
MDTDRFNSNEEETIEITDEILEGEAARTFGYPITHNPYKITEIKKMRDWARGWCDRDMILSEEGRKVEW